MKIYTDGSKGDESTTAAMWIPSINELDSRKLDLGQFRSIMGAELFAISRSLHWLILNQPLIQGQNVVILSDSRSGIMALENHHSRSYSFLTNQIKNLAHILLDSEVNLTIQWVPSHVGVPGNEMADGLAREAHNLPDADVTVAPLDPSEMKSRLKTTARSRWQLQYDLVKAATDLGKVKVKIELWPWAGFKSRKTETAMARLRIGHSRLKDHLFRFGLAETPNCSNCLVPENTVHILEECSRTRAERAIMYQTVRRLGIQTPNTKVLLGGGPSDPATQMSIKRALEFFLTSSGSLDLI